MLTIDGFETAQVNSADEIGEERDDGKTWMVLLYCVRNRELLDQYLKRMDKKRDLEKYEQFADFFCLKRRILNLVSIMKRS